MRGFFCAGELTMGAKLYCGNLAYHVTSADLEQLFTRIWLL